MPGKPYVGIEVPNARSSVVRLKPILESQTFHRIDSPLTVALGRDVSGNPVVADLARMPHLLIAGATGSGKSVCITSLAACLALNNSPQDLRMVMIDSKMVELLRFNGLPHLLGKGRDQHRAHPRVCCAGWWSRWSIDIGCSRAGQARDLDAYNKKQARKESGTALPRIVVLDR